MSTCVTFIFVGWHLASPLTNWYLVNEIIWKTMLQFVKKNAVTKILDGYPINL